jgi:hypothetical protein
MDKIIQPNADDGNTMQCNVTITLKFHLFNEMSDYSTHNFYRRIQHSSKHRVTQLLYRIIVRPLKKMANNGKALSEFVLGECIWITQDLNYGNQIINTIPVVENKSHQSHLNRPLPS